MTRPAAAMTALRAYDGSVMVRAARVIGGEAAVIDRASDRLRPAIGFVSLGCTKALVDSELILTRLRAEGYAIAPTYAGADLVGRTGLPPVRVTVGLAILEAEGFAIQGRFSERAADAAGDPATGDTVGDGDAVSAVLSAAAGGPSKNSVRRLG